MKKYLSYIPHAVSGGSSDPAQFGVYPKSVNCAENLTVFMARDDETGSDVIVACGESAFAGEKIDGYDFPVTAAPLTSENGRVLRELFPFTAPSPVLGYDKSFGVGDRLGTASVGHIRLFERYPEVVPVLAQQSMRELTLTNRTYTDVLNSASFAVFREGFRRPWGADGDHLKRAEDVKDALELGFSMITLDCSEHIDGSAAALDSAGLSAAYTPNALEELYSGKSFDMGDGVILRFEPDDFKRAYLTYGKMINFAEDIYRKFFEDGRYRADFELSIDETATPTDPLAHYFVSAELARRGVKTATVAPRFCGEFQKGIDYVGDTDAFDAELRIHAAIANNFGYKLSVHSGSDKFSVFPAVGLRTNGRWHVKTAGTNWLEAMRVVAICDPALYREVHVRALASFDEASTYYQVTTDLTKIPDIASLSDAELPALFDQNDARQLIHITYGLILDVPSLRERLYSLWRAQEDEYADALIKHIGRHLDLLGATRADS